MRVLYKRQNYRIKDETLIYFDNMDEYETHGLTVILDYLNNMFNEERIFQRMIHSKTQINNYNIMIDYLKTNLPNVSNRERVEYVYNYCNYHIRIYVEEIPDYGIRASIYCINNNLKTI